MALLKTKSKDEKSHSKEKVYNGAVILTIRSKDFFQWVIRIDVKGDDINLKKMRKKTFISSISFTPCSTCLKSGKKNNL